MSGVCARNLSLSLPHSLPLSVCLPVCLSVCLSLSFSPSLPLPGLLFGLCCGEGGWGRARWRDCRRDCCLLPEPPSLTAGRCFTRSTVRLSDGGPSHGAAARLRASGVRVMDASLLFFPRTPRIHQSNKHCQGLKECEAFPLSLLSSTAPDSGSTPARGYSHDSHVPRYSLCSRSPPPRRGAVTVS